MMWAQMDGKLVFKNAVERMIGVLMQACMAKGITGDDIDLFCFHQANLRINQYIAQQLGIPDEKSGPQHPALRQHHRRDDPDPARRGGAERQIEARHEGRDGGLRLGLHLGRGDRGLVSLDREHSGRHSSCSNATSARRSSASVTSVSARFTSLSAAAASKATARGSLAPRASSAAMAG